MGSQSSTNAVMLSNKPSMFMSDLVFFTADSSSILRCHIDCLELDEALVELNSGLLLLCL
jgi:hypothetical protein